MQVRDPIKECTSNGRKCLKLAIKFDFNIYDVRQHACFLTLFPFYYCSNPLFFFFLFSFLLFVLDFSVFEHVIPLYFLSSFYIMNLVYRCYIPSVFLSLKENESGISKGKKMYAHFLFS